MKRFLIVAIYLVTTGATFAQNTSSGKSTNTTKKVSPYKTGVSGFVRNARNLPIADVQAFVYSSDSSATIVSSGYTDAMGYYETNFTVPGKYNLKFVYPSSKSIVINGVPVKKGLTTISLKMNEPDADTSLPVTDFMPKPVEKKQTKIAPVKKG